MLEPDFETNPPTILIVEDDRNLCLVASVVLSQEGYQTEIVSNGERCLQICLDSIPDLILLDAMMPGMDGFACCEILHEKLGEACPPIVIITILDNEESVELAFEKGATEYVTKPINWSVLRRRIYRLLKTRWALQELQNRYHQAQILSQELAEANRQLEKLAAVDGLTQLANRRVFDQRLQEEWQRSRRHSSPLTVILCDIDYFKKYNDYYGHQAGDRCLKEIASILQESCQRAEDLAARYGGEEFAIILGSVTLEQATFITTTIRQQLQKKAIPHASHPHSEIITISMGIASIIPDATGKEEDLVLQADRALYQAKAQGRDCTVLFQL